MTKVVGFSFLLALFLSVVSARSGYVESSYNSEVWRASIGLGKEKVTKLHFFLHDSVGGVNATAVQVAQAITTAQSATNFGALFIDDDPLTEGPEASSMEVGRAQGLSGSTGRDELTLIMAISFAFTNGEFNGSSLSMLGRNPITEPVRELAIVGGTGLFRLAKGFALTRTVELNGLTAIAEYNVTVVHY